MSDDKIHRGERDRSKVSASEPYEVNYAEAEKLIKDHGNDRATLDAAAAWLRSS